MTIPLSVIIAVCSGFLMIGGVMGLAIIHLYTANLINRIEKVSDHSKLAKIRADSAHEKVKQHVKNYHVAR